MLMKNNFQKGVFVSDQREKPQGLTLLWILKFYSKSCYFFDSYQITLKAYLDDTIYGNEQCCSKINAKKACLSQTRGTVSYTHLTLPTILRV